MYWCGRLYTFTQKEAHLPCKSNRSRECLRARGWVGVCVCMTGGMDPAVLGPFWLFLLLSTASVCTLIKTLNLFLTRSLVHTPSVPPPPSRTTPESQFALHSRITIYSHVYTLTHFIPNSFQRCTVAVGHYTSILLSCFSVSQEGKTNESGVHSYSVSETDASF